MTYLVPAVRLDRYVTTTERDVRDYLRAARKWFIGQGLKDANTTALCDAEMRLLWASMSAKNQEVCDLLLSEVL